MEPATELISRSLFWLIGIIITGVATLAFTLIKWRISDDKERAQSAETKIADVSATVDSKIAEAESRIAERVGKLESEVSTVIQADITKLYREVATLQGDIKVIYAELKNLNTNISNLFAGMSRDLTDKLTSTLKEFVHSNPSSDKQTR